MPKLVWGHQMQVNRFCRHATSTGKKQPAEVVALWVRGFPSTDGQRASQANQVRW